MVGVIACSMNLHVGFKVNDTSFQMSEQEIQNSSGFRLRERKDKRGEFWKERKTGRLATVEYV